MTRWQRSPRSAFRYLAKRALASRSGEATVRVSPSECGVSLIFVLILLLVGSLIVGGLAEWAANDLGNSRNFAVARSVSYDATSAIDVAIQSIRYTPLLSPTETLNASPPGPCWPTAAEGGTWANGEPTSPLPNTGGNSFYVWCSTFFTPKSANTRVVTLSACPSVANESLTTQAAVCASRPLVQAVVTFGDYPNGVATPTADPCSPPPLGYCGTTETVDSWLYGPTMPTITKLSCSTASTACNAGAVGGGTTFTITGTGFVAGNTVNFIEEANGIPTTDNVVLAASNVSVSKSGTSITATAPAVTEGSNYFVTVTTPIGTTPYSGADRFTYQAGAPTVTSVCTGPAGTGPTGSTCSTSSSQQGPVAGGTELTIWGTNFWGTNLQEASDSPSVEFVYHGTTLTAQYYTVVSDTGTAAEITATVPADYQVAPSASFDVVVATPAGSSSGSVTFTYVGMVPTVNTVSYNSSSQTVTITGTGFVTADNYSVGFVENSNGPIGKTINASSFTVNSATSITANLPSTGLTNGDTYFVTVTSPSGTSSYYPTFTYS